MTTSPRSLLDWLADQLAEVRHASPLAVLAPVRPVAVPALDDMPFTESVPVCEFEWVETGPCTNAATVRLRTHMEADCHHCRWVTMLACAECFDDWRCYCESELAAHPAPCGDCQKTFRRLSDVILSVIPL